MSINTPHNITHKIILITGASSGIGAACAEIFAAAGAKLILAARNTEKLVQLAHTLTLKHATEIHLLPLDVSQRQAVETAIATLPAAWRQIDVLINNAGVALGKEPLQAGEIADWDIMLDTNVKGLLYVTRAILPAMLQRNCGHIINIGSIAGHQVYPGGAVYCASKFAVNALSQGLRLDVMGSAIRVTSIDPGAVETNLSKVRFKGDIEKANAVYQGFTPLTAADIADAVYYCASCPAHVNISDMIIMPTEQASANHIHRR